MNKKRLLPLAAAVFTAALISMGCATTESTTTEDTTTETVKDISVMVPNGDHEIPVAITMPAGATKVPAVIMMHGTGSNKDEAGNGYVMLAPKMAEAGIAAVRFDFPGSGDSTASYEIYSNTEAVSDADAVAAYISTLDNIDADSIGVMGWSQGGTDALIAAATGKTNYKSVLTWSGALILSDMVTPEMRAEVAEKGYTFMQFDWRDALKLGKNWIDEADNMETLSYVPQIKAPICSIHGTEDEDVPFSDSEKVQVAAANSASKLVPIEGADHTYLVFTGDLTVFNKLIDETVKWFKETL
ncbi:MAG: alpha/beta fold hydrolase [Spirochaetales bacterium]|nr:alpha/beta fold hydrolase [Spirochaetales bacterium]